MDKPFTSYNFTPERSELPIYFKTGMKLTIVRFIIQNDLNFVTSPSLGFQVQIGDTTHPERSFVGFVSPDQQNPKVVEVNVSIETAEDCNAIIRIADQSEEYDYSITMVYDIQPL